MFLNLLKGLSGKAFLEDEIISLNNEVKIKRYMQYTVLGSSILMGLIALSNPSQRKDFILWELGLSSGLGFSSALIEFSRRDIEKRFLAHVKLSEDVAKAEIANRFVKAKITGELSRDISIYRTIEGMPLEAIPEYVEKYDLPRGLYAGILAELMPKNDTPALEATVVKKSLGVAKPDQQMSDLYINSKPMAMVKALAKKFPEYVKDPDNPQWILELIESSSNPDMSKRANQHFIIAGSTQDGKSTLAGVIANGIAERSEGNPILMAHDAKKLPGMRDITRWLCPFTYKIDGYENTGNWIKLCRDIAAEQFRLVGEVGGSCKGVREVVALQDEVNTVYGQGKGYGNMISPETAKDAQSEWLYQATNMAGLRWHMMLLGQSPLSGDTGLSIPAMNNCCFIAMGQTSGYVLDPKNRANFIKNMDEKILDMFSQVAEMLTKEGVRFALVRPTRGNPYIAVIPQFDVDAISNKILGVEPGEEVTEESSDDVTGVDVVAEDSSLEPKLKSDNETPAQDSPPVLEESNSKDVYKQTFTAIVDWMRLCFETYETYPSRELVRKTWKEKTGETLSDVGLDYLISMIMKRLEE